MPRDTSRNKEYFEDRYNKDVSEYENAARELEIEQAEFDRLKREYSGEDINVAYDKYFVCFMRAFYSGYSLGLAKQELTTDWKALVTSVVWSWDPDVYYKMESLLSLAVIFDIDRYIMRPAYDLLRESNYADHIIDSFTYYIDPLFPIQTENLYEHKRSRVLSRVIELTLEEGKREEAAARLRAFLDDEWLKYQIDGVIDNTQHLTEDEYRGYWSIEAAALVKILGLDDEVLKGCKHYPYDLIH